METKSDQLLRRARFEISHLLENGADHKRIEHCVGLLHMAVNFADGRSDEERAPLIGEANRSLRNVFKYVNGDIHAPMSSTAPYAFVISYPRSGNTMVIQSLASLLQAEVLDSMDTGTNLIFSKKAYPRNYSLTRLIKDHEARPEYAKDKCLFVVRDGRDSVISYAHMLAKQQLHSFEKLSDVGPFIEWLSRQKQVESWASHMRAVSLLRREDDKQVVRYEDLLESAEPFRKVVSFVEPKHLFPDDYVDRLWNSRDAIFANLAGNSLANRQWGIGHQFAPDSMFHAWSLNRQKSTWRETWDADAKKAFHESGATQYLMEYGYEDDPDWYRH